MNRTDFVYYDVRRDVYGACVVVYDPNHLPRLSHHESGFDTCCFCVSSDGDPVRESESVSRSVHAIGTETGDVQVQAILTEISSESDARRHWQILSEMARAKVTAVPWVRLSETQIINTSEMRFPSTRP